MWIVQHTGIQILAKLAAEAAKNCPPQSGFETKLSHSMTLTAGPTQHNLDFSSPTSEGGLETDDHAVVRIRALRGKLRGVWWEVHLAPAALCGAFDEMPCLQETGAQGVVHFQFAQGALSVGC